MRFLTIQAGATKTIRQIVESVEGCSNIQSGGSDAKNQVLSRGDPVIDDVIFQGDKVAGGGCIATFSQIVDHVPIATDLSIVNPVGLTRNLIDAYPGGLMGNNVLKSVHRLL